MRSILYAFFSVICVLGFITGVVVGLIILITGGRVSMIHVVIIFAFAILAKVFDRLKMHSLYGVTLGNILHDSDESNVASIQLAKRDLDTLRRNSTRENFNHCKAPSELEDTDDAIIDDDP